MAESQILYGLFGPKNQSLRNKFGKMQPIRTKFGIHGHVKGWQRSGNFGRDRPILGKMGAGTSSAEREFYLCGKPRDLSATSQRPIFTKFGQETYFQGRIQESALGGHLPPSSSSPSLSFPFPASFPLPSLPFPIPSFPVPSFPLPSPLSSLLPSYPLPFPSP